MIKFCVNCHTKQINEKAEVFQNKRYQGKRVMNQVVNKQDSSVPLYRCTICEELT